MQKDNVDGAIKLVTKNLQNGILLLTDTTSIISLLLQLKKSFCLINLKVFIKSNSKISTQVQFPKPLKKPKVVLDIWGWMQAVGKRF